MSASPPNVAPLEYEQRKPFYRRRVPRQVFLLVVGALLLSLIWHYTPSLKELSIASWHRRCAAYSAAAGQVIYDDDPATYQKLPAGVNSSRALRQDRPYALLENPDWQGLNRARHGNLAAPVAFLGTRTSPGGNRRLVAVQFGTVAGDVQYHRFFFVPYVETTNLTGLRATSVGGPARAQVMLFRHAYDSLRVFDGRPDLTAPSRFSIDVQINGTSYTIGGQLEDDDSVTLTPRGASFVKDMNVVCWNPTGVRMFDWLSRAQGATTVPASGPSAPAPQ